jgi:AraC family transcriptional regulator
MTTEGAYGERFGRAFGVETAQTLTATRLERARIAVTRLRCDVAMHHETGRFKPERAFSIGFAQKNLPQHRLWLGGRLVHTEGYAQGGVSVVDLESEPSAEISCPFDCLQVYVPRTALDEMADEMGVRRVSTLAWPRGNQDPVMANLAKALEPALAKPTATETLFVDYIIMALQAHIAHVYGGMRATPSLARGGLAPWQERRAKEFIDARLDGDLSIAELAEACELSRSHFSRAFKQSFGVTPHRWLTQRRVELAKARMIETKAPLSQIALDCGFSDQSHFTRVFSTVVNMSPALWRRERYA